MLENLMHKTKSPLSRLEHLRASPFHAPGETLIHNMAIPFQIAKETVGLWAGLNKARTGVLDYAAGSDLLWTNGAMENAQWERVELFRNTIEKNPLTGGEALFMRFPAGGGFVPCDARLSDGSPHPAAGTGFALCHLHAMPLEVQDVKDGERAREGTWVAKSAVYRCLEWRQVRFDRGRFVLGATARCQFDDLFPGWRISNKAMSAPVPSGASLLWPLACLPLQHASEDRFDTESTVAVSRWIFEQGAWRIESMLPVDESFRGYEPSLVRDVPSGHLLLTARQKAGPEQWEKFAIPLWESCDEGASWEQKFVAERYRANSPLVLGTMLSGNPFVVGNPLVGGVNLRSLGYSRELLALWALSPERDRLESSLLLRCGQLDFGTPPTAHGWKLDHPATSVVEDGSGKFRTLLTYRVQASDENRLKEVSPAPCSGVYIEEVHWP